jgi:hypothetical protein
MTHQQGRVVEDVWWRSGLPGFLWGKQKGLNGLFPVMEIFGGSGEMREFLGCAPLGLRSE